MSGCVIRYFTGKAAVVAPMKKWGVIAVVCFMSFALHAQNSEIRQLEQQLATAPDSLRYVDLLNRIGLLIHMKNADSCFQYSMKATALANRLVYAKGKADALNNMAAAFYLKGLYSQSLSFFTQALTIYRQIGDTADVAEMLMNSAVAYDAVGDSVGAVRFSNQALQKAAHLYPDSIVSMLYANYVNLNGSLPTDSIAAYLDKARAVAKHFGDDRVLLFIKQLEANRFITAGNMAAALPLILSSIDMARQHQWESHELEGLGLYGDYFEKLGKVDSALVCYHTMYRIAEANGYVFFIPDILQSLLRCYELKKDVAHRLETNKLLVAALEQQNNNNKKFIGDYVQYNKAIEDLRLSEARVGRGTRAIWGLIVLVVVGLVSVGIIFYFYRKSVRLSDHLAALNEQLMGQHTLLQQSDAFKNRLVSMLAHDFRAPLHSLSALISLLREGMELNVEEAAAFYLRIENDIREILLTFDNMLEWVRRQLSGYQYSPVQIDVREAMKEVCALFAENLAEKRLWVINDIAEHTWLETDRELIQFVHRNLIHNAIKFSPLGSVIEIGASVRGAELVVSVRDQGEGMNAVQVSHLFAFQTDDSYSTNKGAGIALTICKEFLQRLGGRIWVETAPGKGATFYYALPVNAWGKLS